MPFLFTYTHTHTTSSKLNIREMKKNYFKRIYPLRKLNKKEEEEEK